MIGGGKYEDLCTALREQLGASAVVLIVADGKRGSGFSAQAVDPALLAVKMPMIMEIAAAEMRADAARLIVPKG